MGLEDDVLEAEVVLDADTDHSSDWEHGENHGGFHSDGDGVANGGGDKAELAADVVLDADTEHSSEWDHGRDHGGFNSDGNGVADGGDKQLVAVHGATPKVTAHSAG